MRKFRILSIFLCYKEIKLSGYENNKTVDCDVKTIGKHINNALRGNYFSIALNFNYFCKTIKCTCKYDSLYC